MRICDKSGCQRQGVDETNTKVLARLKETVDGASNDKADVNVSGMFTF